MFNREVDVDVAVIGGGLAGIRAALASHSAGAATAMLLKGSLGKSGSSAIAGGGLAAVLKTSREDDSVEKHVYDTMVSGDFINDIDLVRRMAELAPQAIEELEELGAEFVRKDEEIQLFLAPAHSARRSIRCEGGGSERMMAPLSQYVRDQPIQVLEQTAVLELLTEGNQVIGLVAVQENEKLILVRCRAIVLAAGGAGRIFPLTSTKEEMTGDGYALALRNGLALTGMEFVQFTPTALAYPKEVEGTSTGGVLLGLEGTRLWNSKKERFMEQYDPDRKEASTRAIVSRAITKEIMEGRGTPHGGVHLDLTQNDHDTLDHIASHFMKKLEPYQIDIKKDLLEIAPAVHYFMGGVEVDPGTATKMRGLYAAGEVTGGVQGSNRLSSNALSEANVFGKLAGIEAAKFAAHEKSVHWDSLYEKGRKLLLNTWDPSVRVSQTNVLQEIHKRIQSIMLGSAGLERCEEQMEKGVSELHSLRKAMFTLPPSSSAEIRKRYEVMNMLAVAEAVVKSAQIRTESRGSHYRSDYPEMNNEEWLAITRAYLMNGEIRVEKKACKENLVYAQQMKN